LLNITILKKFNKPTVLIAPLDWGLGHVTRCIPIIKILINNNFKIIVACNERQQNVLKTEFDDISFVFLKGYNIQYSQKAYFFSLKIVLQIPKIIAAIQNEKKWLDNFINKEKIDLVISDNRFGFYNKNVPGIFITHQLTIKAPFRWLENCIQKLNYRFINKFTACWVPDNKLEDSIAGLLSHPKKMPKIPVNYIGILSRFNNNSNISINKYDICILLSGPEPQRTVFENTLLSQLENSQLKVLFLRGLPNSSENIENSSIEILNHLPQQALQNVICNSNIIVARSGYTTVMELLSLQKKSILVATPGQTEQEYLANYLSKQNRCLAYNQKDFNLKTALNEARFFKFKFSKQSTLQESIILDLVNSLFQNNGSTIN